MEDGRLKSNVTLPVCQDETSGCQLSVYNFRGLHSPATRISWLAARDASAGMSRTRVGRGGDSKGAWSTGTVSCGPRKLRPKGRRRDHPGHIHALSVTSVGGTGRVGQCAGHR